MLVTDFRMWCVFFFFKQKTAYEMRISDWSSDVCSSDLAIGEAENTVLQYEFREGIDAYLAGLPGDPPARDLAGLIAFNKAHAQEELRWRSEERRVGKECVRPCRSRWSPYH